MNSVTRVLITERHVGQSEEEDVTTKAVSERKEDATLLALKAEEGVLEPRNTRGLQTLEKTKNKEIESRLGPPEGIQPC